MLSEKLETLGWEIKEIADKFVNFRYFRIVRKNDLCRLIYFKLKFMQLDKAMYQIYIVNAFNFGVGHLINHNVKYIEYFLHMDGGSMYRRGFFGLFFVLFCFFYRYLLFLYINVNCPSAFFTGVSNIVLHKVFSWLIFI